MRFSNHSWVLNDVVGQACILNSFVIRDFCSRIRGLIALAFPNGRFLFLRKRDVKPENVSKQSALCLLGQFAEISRVSGQ
jgi:hypothetical protein